VGLHDARGARHAYGERMVMRRSYAVVWENGAGVDSGRLELGLDALQLVGREHLLSVPYAGLADVRIARGPQERIRGLPVLVLRRPEGDIRVASLEGAGILHELTEHIVHAGLTGAAA
jgi:hypothetical protein